MEIDDNLRPSARCCFGFRPKRSAHDAIRKSLSHIGEGYKYVVDMDLEKYFDTVNQSKIVEQYHAE